MGTNISLALQGIWGHKLRSFLTMLGIIIGIASLITIVSTINGTNQQIKENIVGAGTNVVKVSISQEGYPADFSYQEVPDGVGFITDDMVAELAKLKGVKSASAYKSRQWVDGVYYRNNTFNGSVYGIDEKYLDTCGMIIVEGRGFTKEERSNYIKSAIVDSKTASGLFSGTDVVGSIIEIQGEPFRVVGICDESRSSAPVINNINDYYTYSGDNQGSIYIPRECWDIVYRYDEPSNVAVKANSTDEMTNAGKSVADYLNEHIIDNTNYQYKAEDLLEQAAKLQSLSQSTNTQLIWIACIALLVGGIGVMNIMLVSVTERTREIGIKKAIGAKQRVIRLQFLTEAAVLTLIGGIIGVIVGIALSYMMSMIIGTPVAISVPACIIAVVFSMAIGIVFGFAPAVKAAKLNPIEALRRE